MREWEGPGSPSPLGPERRPPPSHRSASARSRPGGQAGLCMSSSDEVCGSGRRSGCRAEEPASGASKRRRALLDASVAGDVVDEVGDICFLCEQSFGGVDYALLGQQFHRDCIAAVRRFRRMAHKLGGVDCSDALMMADPVAWRAQVTPLIKNASSVSRAAARATVRKTLAATEHYVDRQRVASKRIVDRARFCRHRRHEGDDADSDALNLEFDKLLKEQRRRYCVGAKDKVAISDDEREVTVSGSKGSQKILHETLAGSNDDDDHDDHDDHDDEVAAGTKETHGRGRPRSRDRRHERGQRNRSGDRRRRPFCGVDRSGGAASSFAAVDRRGGARGRERSPPAHASTRQEPERRSGKAVATPTPSKQSDRCSGRSARGRESRQCESESDLCGSHSESGCDSVSSQPAATPTPKKCKGGESASKKLTPVMYMQEKTALLRSAREVFAARDSRRSTYQRLKSATEKLSEKEVGQLDDPPRDILDKMHKADHNLKKAMQQLEGSKLSQWVSMQDMVEAALVAVREARRIGDLTLDAVTYMLDQNSKVEKHKKNTERYKKVRLANKLTAGGFCKAFSKFLSVRTEFEGRVVSPRIPTNSVLDPGVPTPVLFISETVAIGRPMTEAEKLQGSAMCSAMGAFVAGADLQDKRESLIAYLAANKDATGAMCRVEADMQLVMDIPGLEATKLLDTTGSHPWLTTFRPLQKRYGPLAWPLPGYAALAMACPASAPVLFLVGPAAPILSLGIALSGVPNFVGTQAGLKFADEHLLLIKVPPGASLWIPYGFILFAIALETEPDPKDSTAEDLRGTVGEVLVLNPALPQHAAAMPSGAQQAVREFNATHLDRVAHKKAWSPRADWFKAFGALTKAAAPRAAAESVT